MDMPDGELELRCNCTHDWLTDYQAAGHSIYFPTPGIKCKVCLLHKWILQKQEEA
jgi:hypothetical protein